MDGFRWAPNGTSSSRMKVLLLGGGGREHAIGWKLRQSGGSTGSCRFPATRAWRAGSAGSKSIPTTSVGLDMAGQGSVDLVVVGPEAPLAAGLVDALGPTEIPVWGPTRAAAAARILEEVRQGGDGPGRGRHRPLGGVHEVEPALAFSGPAAPPYVVKADGLAAGKGVLVTEDWPRRSDWAAMSRREVRRNRGRDRGVSRRPRGERVRPVSAAQM